MSALPSTAANHGLQGTGGAAAREPLKCPRCESSNTKFCYYNNYSRSQPRHFCRACRRHWTDGGSLRNVPVGGGRRHKRSTKAQRQQQQLQEALLPVDHCRSEMAGLQEMGGAVWQSLQLLQGEEYWHSVAMGGESSFSMGWDQMGGLVFAQQKQEEEEEEEKPLRNFAKGW